MPKVPKSATKISNAMHKPKTVLQTSYSGLLPFWGNYSHFCHGAHFIAAYSWIMAQGQKIKEGKKIRSRYLISCTGLLAFFGVH